jgi:hypothetical protein
MEEWTLFLVLYFNILIFQFISIIVLISFDIKSFIYKNVVLGSDENNSKKRKN